MRSLLNVPAEVVSANINAAVAKAAAKKRRIFVLGIMAGAFIAMGASQAVWQSIILRMWELQGPCRMYFPSGTYDDRVYRRRTVYRGLYDVHGMYERPYWLWKPFKDFDRLSGEFCRSGADRLSGGSQRPV